MGILSEEEKATLKSVLPKKEYRILCATKATLYVAAVDPEVYEDSGFRGGLVLTCQKQSSRNYLKIVDLQDDQGVIWSELIVSSLDYKQDRSFFHSFDSSYGYYAGLMFDDVADSRLFFKRVTSACAETAASSGDADDPVRNIARTRPQMPPLHPAQAAVLNYDPDPPLPPPKDGNSEASTPISGSIGDAKTVPIQAHPSKFPARVPSKKPTASAPPYQVSHRQDSYRQYQSQQSSVGPIALPLPPRTASLTPIAVQPQQRTIKEHRRKQKSKSRPVSQLPGDTSMQLMRKYSMQKNRKESDRKENERRHVSFPGSPTSFENRQLRDSLMEILKSSSTVELSWGRL